MKCSSARLGFEQLEVREVPAVLLAVTGDQTLLRFDSANPSAGTTVNVTGLNVGEALLGIDTRPANGLLYALTSQSRLVTLDGFATDTTAATTFVALAADPTDLTNPFTTLNGTSFGIDFDPVADRLRVVSDVGQNLRINAANGLVVTDGDLNPGALDVVNAAYTNSLAGATTTTLYAMDDLSDLLVTIDPPNNGNRVIVGPLGADVTLSSGFDIVTTGDPVTPVNTAYAILTAAGTQGLYTIDLGTGATTLVAGFDALAPTVRGLVVLSSTSPETPSEPSSPPADPGPAGLGFADRVFPAVLGRAPTADEAARVNAVLAADVSPLAIVDFLVKTPEGRFQALNQTFQQFFGRGIDLSNPLEVNQVAGFLASNAPITQVIANVLAAQTGQSPTAVLSALTSDVGTVLVVNQLVNNFLGRDATATELALLGRYFQSTTDLETIAGVIVTSGEFLSRPV